MRDVFEKYILELRKAYAEEGTEHSGRSALQTLLDAFAAKENPPAHVQHEPKHVVQKGAPDFKVSRQGMILGYVENKAIGENLAKILKSEQIAKYKSLSDNIVLTDYLQFIWINKYGPPQAERLCEQTDLENPKFQLREERVAAVAKLLEGFFSTAPEGIGQAEQLALALATRSQLLRDFIGKELVRQERDDKTGKLYGLYQVFRDQVFHELTLKEFADAFAQMLAYGLFLARLNSGKTSVTLHNAREHVPGSFRLIRELVEFIPVLTNPNYRDVRWVVEEILSIVNCMDLAAIREDLSFRHRKVRRGVKAKSEEEARLFERDPFVYFYEDYLSRYDPKLRESRGVYYTPPPVVNFIVRAIDDILKDKDVFGIKDGVADHSRVTVLDFACGTGTFLVEVFERIFETIGGPRSGKAAAVVHEHMLKNIYGFEYLIAPYTIAHLKLSQYLKDKGHSLKDEERLLIYLTNTLEPISPLKNRLLPELTREVEAAQEVKEKPILVITGNPPYSGHSRNMGPVARASIDAYKLVNGKPLGERNPKWLQDDYVKFIRFAQMKMDGFSYALPGPDGKPVVHSVKGVENGVVGVITNHSWLDNPTFRGMRRSLMTTFDQIYVLDLHGNARRKERAPDGGEDQNVFDIEQGVAITLFVKKPDVVEKGVWRADLWGKRLEKYHSVLEKSKDQLGWEKISPAAPFYLFVLQNQSAWAMYAQGWAVTDIFKAFGVGLVTARDKLTIHFDKDDLRRVIEDFSRLDSDVARAKYKLGSDVRDWRVEWAQADLKETGLEKSLIATCLYRPFDQRWTYYTGRSRGFMCMPRGEIMGHMLSENIGLITNRSQEIPGQWTNVLCLRT